MTDFRTRLAADIPYETVRNRLKDIIDSAGRDTFISHNCPKCNRTNKVPVKDLSTVLSAIKFWSETSFGRSAMAKAAAAADFTGRDPLELEQAERAVLFERVMGALEKKV